MKCLCSDCASNASTATRRCFKDLWIFETFSEVQMDEIQKIGLKRTILAGNPVFTQGSPANEIFLIKVGRIKLTKLHKDGAEITLDFRKAGDVLGEDAFSGESDYPLGAWALEDTITCGFGLRDFNALVLKRPDIGLSLIRSMSAKLSSVTGRLDAMAENSLENKLHRILSQVAREHGVAVEGGFELGFPLTHEELGFLVGAHRVSVTKAMKFLVECGKVVRNGRKLILPLVI